jgi:DNA uptake protein ComE-like DNA-binding protein
MAERSANECLTRTSTAKGESIMANAIGDAQGVDLNSADERALERVGGLGPERARRLIENRPFRSWDDLHRIEGFNDKLVEDLKRSGATLGQPGRA